MSEIELGFEISVFLGEMKKTFQIVRYLATKLGKNQNNYL